MDSPKAFSNPLNILIVEDNRDARTTLRMLLSLAYGHSVIEAEDGLRGLQIAVEHTPDVALIDLGLPMLSGFEVARRLRDLPGGQRIFVVALTGYGGDEDRALTEAAGFDLHLVKPIDAGALEAMLALASARVKPEGDARQAQSAGGAE